MPKKFGTNTKSAEARAKKEELKQADKHQKERAAQDALWIDDDKHIARKQQRKEEKDKKKTEMLEKKAALKQIYEEEMSSIKAAKARAAEKVTRAEIAALAEKQQKPQKEELLLHEKPLEENVNRIMVEGDEARTVDEAIAVLSVGDAPVDRHPERRAKAAYEAYEARMLPGLKAENPNLRLSQLKQMIRKDWMKSPENPLNQRF
ncbi:hypothetical protein HPB47_015727 [Ixodes persulcatus]|uniref:Uncharacterized protein n=1 Tax=Ixodes persulcatus TaxID=34615 RepID=A0AC60QTY6_IXOPE|nr:hypothetical protein HPB47_015727 [Ixodes persulcatus]